MKTSLLSTSLILLTLFLAGCFGGKKHEVDLVAHIIEKMTAKYGADDVVYFDVHLKALKDDQEATEALHALLEKRHTEGAIQPTLRPFPQRNNLAAEEAFLEDSVPGDTTAVLLVNILKWRSPHEVEVQVSLMDTPGQAKGGTMTLLNRNAIEAKKKHGKPDDKTQAEAPEPDRNKPVWQVIESDHWFN